MNIVMVRKWRKATGWDKRPKRWETSTMIPHTDADRFELECALRDARISRTERHALYEWMREKKQVSVFLAKQYELVRSGKEVERYAANTVYWEAA